MCMINNIATAWMKLEASMLENYKYTVEGNERTAGSYMLTNIKSAITLGEKDPDMFRVQNMFRATPILGAFAAGVVIASAGTFAISKAVDKHKKNNNEKTINKESN